MKLTARVPNGTQPSLPSLLNAAIDVKGTVYFITFMVKIERENLEFV